MRKTRTIKTVVAALCIVAAAFSCATQNDPAPKTDEAREHEEHDHEEHDHGDRDEEGGSDLDRPVEELFATRCEHDMPTYQCDECRYEVGVVEVPAELVEKGLVKLGAVKGRRIDSEIELTGEIDFDEKKIVHLGPRANGVIRKVTVGVGQSVKAGQTLVELDSAELADTEGAYLEALADRRLKKKALERQRSLREAAISSEREYLEAKNQFDSAEIKLDSIRHKLVRLGQTGGQITRLEKAETRAAPGRLRITAPFDAEVLSMHAVRGEQVSAGDQMLLLGDVGSLWLWVDVYETQLAAATRAMDEGALKASVGVGAFPGKRFAGEVDFIGRVMDRHTRTVKARIVLENPSKKLKPGMFANVRLGIGRTEAALAVPSEAVLTDEGRDFVFVHHKDDYFVRRPVVKGPQEDGFVEVRGDLKAGQEIAVAGVFLLKSDVLREKMGAGCAD